MGEILQVEMEPDNLVDKYAVVGPRCNLGDEEGLQVPCELHIVGQKKYMDVLYWKMNCQNWDYFLKNIFM